MLDNILASKLYRAGAVAYVSRSGGESVPVGSRKSRRNDRSEDHPGAGHPSDARIQATVTKLNVIEATNILQDLPQAVSLSLSPAEKK